MITLIPLIAALWIVAVAYAAHLDRTLPGGLRQALRKKQPS